MNSLLAIAFGGAAGALLRYGSVNALHGVLGRGFPYGTLFVNVSGSLLIGLLYVMLVERFNLAIEWRAGLMIGFLGAFTTFSSFSMETLNLLEQGEMMKVALNIVLSVSLCLIACWLGLILGRQL